MTRTFERFVGVCALGAAAAGVLFSIAFSIVVQEADPEFALLGLVLGSAGALGAATHAAYELGVLANPDYESIGISPVDPRGFMTFAITGLALLVFGRLLRGSDHFPRHAATLALTGAALLVVVYVARLTVLDPKANVIRLAGLISGLVVVPTFYLLVGRQCLRGDVDGHQTT